MDATAIGLTWRKSSYSGGEGGDCVEVAASGELRWFRDSKSPAVCPLPVSAAAWRSLVSAVSATV